jgi:hypothetical protein
LWINYLLGGMLTLLTLRATGRSVNVVLGMGALILVMLFISPVCHLHYYVFALPLVMGLMAQDFQAHNRVSRGLKLILAVNTVTWIVPNLPGMEFWREVGLATYGALLIWLTAVVRLWKSTASDVWRRDPHVWPRSTRIPLENEGRAESLGEGISPVAYAPGSSQGQ